MSINFSTLQGLTIPEGVVTQITDAAGRVIWAVQTSKPARLAVKKVTATTYAGETEYADENFVVLNVYPRKNSTAKVTYGGLTKTVTDTSGVDNPNGQSVYFGTLYGVTDSVATPTSGELTIEGNYNYFTVGTYTTKGKYGTGTIYCDCVTNIIEWGNLEEEIPNLAFSGCTGLTLSSLPSGVTSIGASAFSGCTGLTLSSLPSGVTSIGASAFNGCTGLTLSSLPSGVTSIGASAFNGCTGLTAFSIPNSITNISNGMFCNCSNLTLASLPSSITYIGDSAFANCTSLALTSLPSGLTYIGASAFANVSSIALNMLPSGLTYIGDKAFYISGGSSDNGGISLDKVSLSFVTLPSGLTYIGSFTAYSNDSLTIVDVSNATGIGDYAFYACENVTKLTIGDSLTAIGAKAFSFINNLIEVTIGKNVASIGERAFESNGENKKYTFLSTTPPVTTGNYIFGHSAYGSIAQIIVPKGCGDAYRTALSYYASKIVEES